MSNVVIGTLKNMGDVEYRFYPEDGRHPVHIAPDIAKGVQYNYRIWLDMDTGDWGRMSEVLGSEVRERKHILLLKTCPEDTDEEERQAIADATKRIGAELERFYQFYGNDIWDVQVHADAVRENQAPWNNNWNAQMFRSYINDHQPQMPAWFIPNYFHCWSHYGHGSYCGLGQLHDKYSWTQESCGLHTIIHELGHNFGLHHASRGDREYGDSTCVMGSGRDVPGLNAVQIAKLRRAARRPFWKVTESAAGYIVPIETSDYWLSPDDNVLAEVENRGQRVWVSLRKHRGVPYDFKSPPEERLHVHTKTSDGKTHYQTAIYPDRVHTLPNGVKCYHLGYDPQQERATVYFAYENGEIKSPAPQPRGDWPENLPDEIGDNDEGVYDGLWYNQEFDGQGVSILGRTRTLFTFKQGEVHMPRTDPTYFPLWQGNSRLIPLDRNNMLLLMNDKTYGKVAFEMKRLTLPPTGSLTGAYIQDDGAVYHIHKDILQPDGSYSDVVLITLKDGKWYYAEGDDLLQAIPVYRSNLNRFLARGSRTLTKVGMMHILPGRTLNWNIGDLNYTVEI